MTKRSKNEQVQTTKQPDEVSDRFSRQIISAVLFMVVGLVFFGASRANVATQSVELENASLSQGASTLPDQSASNGQYVKFEGAGDGTELWQEAFNAGLSDESILEPSGGFTYTTDGGTIENLDVSGVIRIRANNVTIRNVRVTFGGNAYGIFIESGYEGTVIEQSHLIGYESSSGSAPNAMVYNGPVTVRYTEIEGAADGVKVDSDSLYEYNYVHMYISGDSEKHLDGFQNIAQNAVIRGNIVHIPIKNKGNAAYIPTDVPGDKPDCYGPVTLEGNLLSGGNYTVFGGEFKLILRNNAFANDWDGDGEQDHRWGYMTSLTCSESVREGNYVYETGEPLWE